MLVPIGESENRLSHEQIVSRMRELRSRIKPGKTTLRQMIAEGRRCERCGSRCVRFPDEASEYADAALVGLEAHTILVPALWPVEVANALLVGERSRRLREADIQKFMELIENLNLLQDAPTAASQTSHVFSCAREYGLTAYDAAYLELAMRQHARLAPFDAKLRKAAKRAGVSIFMVAL